MKKSLQMQCAELKNAFGQHCGWFMAYGFALVVLGTVAICAATMTTLISVILLGALLFIGGLVALVDTFKFSRLKRSSFWLHLFMSLLYLAVGYMLMTSPMSGSISLTLLLGIFYTILGLSRLYYSFAMRLPNWGWGFLSGLVTLLLGILILANWPASSLFIIGLFIGIDLIFAGWAYIMAAGMARQCLMN